MKIDDIKLRITSMADVPNFLKEFGLNKHICELGVWRGDGLINLINCDPEILIGVDCWDDTDNTLTTDGCGNDTMKIFYKESLRIMLKHKNIKLIKSYTNDAVDLFEDGYFDFLYIDGCHTYEQCKQDLNNWFSKVRSGGIISGHDYFEHTASYKFGVVQAVNEFIENKKDEIEFMHVTGQIVCPSYFILKK